jgi:FtsH-binding integral membrane protein
MVVLPLYQLSSALKELYGYTTQRDLTSFGSFLFMGLIGIIIASLSISALERALLAHLGARRAHLHRPHRRHAEHQRDVQPDGAGRKAVMGALPLYLDFINLFLMLLQLFGDRRE